MTTAHHPSDMVLAEFANAALDEAAGLVVGVHIAHCPECRKTVRRCEALGGAMLAEASPGVDLQTGALALLERLELDPAAAAVLPSVAPQEQGDEAGVLAHYERGDWRWVGPGIHVRKISVPSEQNIRVFMLKAKSGTTLPHHKHSGIEWTQVLEGAFVHAHGRFGPGDFDEADSSVDHDPVVEQGQDCVCLVAMTGKLELQGVLGRVMQPFVRL